MCAQLHLLTLCLLLASCAPPRVTPQKLRETYKAHHHESISQLHYMGSKGGDHYFCHERISLWKDEYRVPRERLSIQNEFPLTKERSQWRQCMIVELDAVGNGGILLVPNKSIPLSLGEGPVIDGIQKIRN